MLDSAESAVPFRRLPHTTFASKSSPIRGVCNSLKRLSDLGDQLGALHAAACLPSFPAATPRPSKINLRQSCKALLPIQNKQLKFDPRGDG